jgi:hypothetical protein
MTLGRFEDIKGDLHLTHPYTAKFDVPDDRDYSRQLWHAKVDSVVEQLTCISKAIPVPKIDVSVDESILRCTGRTKHKSTIS